jgi:hypothetical protein
METYTVSLTEAPRTYVSEGAMDTTVVNGLSLQRTFEMTMVVNEEGGMKIVGKLADGATYNDDTTYSPEYQNQPGHPDFV